VQIAIGGDQCNERAFAEYAAIAPSAPPFDERIHPVFRRIYGSAE
jgi:hypothetical protein